MLILGAGLMVSVCWAGEETPKDRKFMESYSLGYEFGTNLVRQEMDIDREALFSAIKDALSSKTPVISYEQIKDTLKQLKRNVIVLQERRFRELAQKNIEEARAFLEANKSKEGVKTLPNGLQYKVIREGDGPVPKASDIVKVQYRGTLINGTEFGSSYERAAGPVIGRADGLMRGWTEALKLMKVGSKWQLFVPPSLGYGEDAFQRIPPNSVLIYDIELLSIEKGPVPVPALTAPAQVEPAPGDSSHPDNTKK